MKDHDRANRLTDRARKRLEAIPILYDVLMESVEKDTATTAAMITRMSDRLWAYRTAAGVPPGDSSADLAKLFGLPPTPAGWIDLTYLLTYLGEFELAEQVFHRGSTALNETRRLTLQFILDEAMGRPIAGIAARLRDRLSSDEDAIYLAYPDFRRRAGVPFDRSAIRRMPTPKLDDRWLASPTDLAVADIHRRMNDMDTHLNRNRQDLEPRVTAWSIDHAEGMPGQTLVVRRPPRKIRGSFSWKPAGIEQGTQEFKNVEKGSEHAIHDFGTNTTWMKHYIVLPLELKYGPANIHVESGVIPIRVISRPAPPVIRDAPSMTAPGHWMVLRVRQLVLSEKNQMDPSVKLILEQGGKDWRLEWFLTSERGRLYEARLVCRVPGDAREGRAQLKVVQRGVASDPLDLCLVDGYSLRDGYAPLNLKDRKSLPGESHYVWAHTPADAFRFLAKFQDGIAIPWNPERATSLADPRPGGIWRIPASWPAGGVELRGAHLQGEVWHLSFDHPEFMDILSKPPAPEIRRVTFISKKPYRLNDTIELKPGSLWFGGDPIVAGDLYVVVVRWESASDLSIEKPAAGKGIWFAELPHGSTRPDAVRIARVVNGVVGDFAERQVESQAEYGMNESKTLQGRAATKWLRDVREHIEVDEPPTLEELLRQLNLTQLPVSPYGGPWQYIPTPGGRSYTFLAFDREGTLKLQFNDGGPSSLFVEYDAIRRYDEHDEENSFGSARENLLWVAPWEDGGLGNVVADAARAAAGADVGVYNPTGLCGNFPKGGISEEMVVEALPYDNELIVLRMTGADLAAFFQEAAVPDRFLYVSGLQIKVHPKAALSDSQAVTLFDDRGRAISMDRTYTLAANDYLVDRARYATLARAASKKSTGIHIRDAVVEYVRKNSPLNRPSNRWR